MSILNKQSIITHCEVNDTLKELHSIINKLIDDRGFGQYKNNLIDISNVISVWTSYYNLDKDLIRLNETEIDIVKDNLSKVPLVYFKNEKYGDLKQLDNLLNKVIYFGKYPIGREFNLYEFPKINVETAINRLIMSTDLYLYDYEYKSGFDDLKYIYEETQYIKKIFDKTHSLPKITKKRINLFLDKLKDFSYNYSIDLFYNCAKIIQNEYIISTVLLSE